MSRLGVGIVMGSKSDLEAMSKATGVLDEYGIPWEMRIASAHRTPDVVHAWAEGAPGRGIGVLICGAGMAAHLAGVVAASSLLPVIGVPLAGSPMQGLDSLMSTVQMPPGVPVATVAIGSAGARNAAHLAARILAVGDPELAERLAQQWKAMSDKVREDDAALQGDLADD